MTYGLGHETQDWWNAVGNVPIPRLLPTELLSKRTLQTLQENPGGVGKQAF